MQQVQGPEGQLRPDDGCHLLLIKGCHFSVCVRAHDTLAMTITMSTNSRLSAESGFLWSELILDMPVLFPQKVPSSAKNGRCGAAALKPNHKLENMHWLNEDKSMGRAEFLRCISL